MTGPRWAARVLLMLLCAGSVFGDEAPKATSLPRYYGKLGLDKEQTEKVRKTRARFRSRIDELKRQLRALEKGEQAELEKHLTDPQRAQLKDLRAQGTGTFKISAPRQPLRLQAGKSTTFAVELSRDKAFEGDVTLTYPDLPREIKIQPSPYVFKEGADSIGDLTIRTDKSLATGDYRITIRAETEDLEPVETTILLRITL